MYINLIVRDLWIQINVQATNRLIVDGQSSGPNIWLTADKIEKILRPQLAATHSNDPYVDDYYHQARLEKKSAGAKLRHHFCPTNLNTEQNGLETLGTGCSQSNNWRRPFYSSWCWWYWQVPTVQPTPRCCGAAKGARRGLARGSGIITSTCWPAWQN